MKRVRRDFNEVQKTRQDENKHYTLETHFIDSVNRPAIVQFMLHEIVIQRGEIVHIWDTNEISLHSLWRVIRFVRDYSWAHIDSVYHVGDFWPRLATWRFDAELPVLRFGDDLRAVLAGVDVKAIKESKNATRKKDQKFYRDFVQNFVSEYIRQHYTREHTRIYKEWSKNTNELRDLKSTLEDMLSEVMTDKEQRAYDRMVKRAENATTKDTPFTDRQIAAWLDRARADSYSRPLMTYFWHVKLDEKQYVMAVDGYRWHVSQFQPELVTKADNRQYIQVTPKKHIMLIDELDNSFGHIPDVKAVLPVFDESDYQTIEILPALKMLLTSTDDHVSLWIENGQLSLAGEGSPLTAVNKEYLIDALQGIQGKYARLAIRSQNIPMAVKHPDSDYQWALIMPCSIRR